MSKNSKEIKRISVAVGCLYKRLPNWDQSQDSSPYRFLLVKRRDEYISELDNVWELPGGKVEPNELHKDTVEREILEETGYKAKAIERLHRFYTYTRVYPDKKLRVNLVCFLCELDSDYRTETEKDKKISEVKWFEPNEINYRQTLQGSREFIIDVANYLGIQVIPQVEKSTYHIELKVLSPTTPEASERLGRHYSLTIQFDTRSNEYYIITFRGGQLRFGNEPKTEEFTDYKKMISQARKRIRDRHNHGYVLTYCDKDFPLLEWMATRGISVVTEQDKTERITQLRLDI